jgi:hypothetical protein
MSTTVPTPETIEAKIAALNVIPEQHEAAALHLATPVGCVVGVHVRIEDGSYQWRGRRVGRIEDGDLTRICAGASTLALLGWQAGDLALKIEGNCLKVVRSGAYMLIGGSFMYGGPEILCNVEPDTAIEIAAHWLKLQSPPQSGVLEVNGVQYLTCGDTKAVFIHRVDGTLSGWSQQSQFDVDEIGAVIQARLGLDDLEAASIGSRFVGTVDIDYVGKLHTDNGSYQVVIPCTIGTSVSIGAPSGVAVPNTQDWCRGHRDGEAWDEIDGYTKLEPARFEPGWVALHEASRTPVIIRRDDGA